MNSAAMRTLALASLLAACLALASCNTAIGFGRDIRSLGEGMENTAYGRTWDGQERPQQQGGSASNPQQPVY